MKTKKKHEGKPREKGKSQVVNHLPFKAETRRLRTQQRHCPIWHRRFNILSGVRRLAWPNIQYIYKYQLEERGSAERRMGAETPIHWYADHAWYKVWTIRNSLLAGYMSCHLTKAHDHVIRSLWGLMCT